jgi:pimeloyl-ACP methyl ester carboxylesterase
MLTVDGYEIFHRIEGNGPPLLLIHGFPTASWDWHALWPALAARHRCIAIDLLGFGYSAKPRRDVYRVAEQAARIEVVLEHHGIGRCAILAHDLGDTVAQELIARTPERWAAVALLNGGVFPETHRPLLTQKLLAGPLGGFVARIAGRPALARSFRRIFGTGTQPDARLLDACQSLIDAGGGRPVLARTIGYMRERVVHRERWVGVLVRATMPLRYVVGMADPISGAHVAARWRELIPQADVVELPGIGHYPQVEAPQAVLDAVLPFFARATARLHPG